jgi:hypothetical protein
MKESRHECVILKHTEDGSCEIPESAWADLARAVRDTFDATLDVHDQCCAEAYPDLETHYFVQIFEETHDLGAMCPVFQFIKPRVHALIDKYTTPPGPLL